MSCARKKIIPHSQKNLLLPPCKVAAAQNFYSVDIKHVGEDDLGQVFKL